MECGLYAIVCVGETSDIVGVTSVGETSMSAKRPHPYVTQRHINPLSALHRRIQWRRQESTVYPGPWGTRRGPPPGQLAKLDFKIGVNAMKLRKSRHKFIMTVNIRVGVYSASRVHCI